MPPIPPFNRRRFLEATAESGAASLAAAAILSSAGAAEPQTPETVSVGVMGLSRGTALALNFAKQPGVAIRYVCDVDQNRAAACAKRVGQLDDQQPQPVADFRKILDDPQIDALICAAPNHWHAPATILACQAGKHVYVEKPCSHNAREGELMIAAARKHRSAVQMGAQRRSGPGHQESMQLLRDGVIGNVRVARCWYFSARGSIGTAEDSTPPSHIDYDLWQGPAPRVPFRSNVVHYNWHWFWHWGNGELGNNGVHTIDIARWGLGVDFPVRVTSSGGRYYFDDDQETPDTHTVCYEFDGGRMLTWEGLSCNKNGGGFVTFYGDNGSLALEASGKYSIFDRGNKLVREGGQPNQGDDEHILNFLQAVRSPGTSLNAEIEEGHRSTLLCHLGNISQRTGRSLRCDPADGRIVDDSEAMQLWSRDYEPGWAPTSA